ncbi:MAG: hypothetical protein KUG73_08710, partial [Pseudomonadales bacterium]|nr:hypothetical protein [Pseudomonadales bacterium]
MIKTTRQTEPTKSPPRKKPYNKIVQQALWLVPISFVLAGCDKVGEFPDQETICEFDTSRENIRSASAAEFLTPVIQSIAINGSPTWNTDTPSPLTMAPGDIITLYGENFGQGVDVDFSKIMIGTTRILETDLTMFEQKIDIQKQVNFEISDIRSEWPKNILHWENSRIEFRVPDHASSGLLTVQVQKRTGFNESLIRPGEAHNVIDALTARITEPDFEHNCDVVSTLSETKSTASIDVTVDNPEFDELVAQGRAIFWSYDYNIGAAHNLRGLDWEKIFN